MAVTGKMFGKCLLSAFNKEIDFDTDTIKVMLCTSLYAPNQDTHQYKSSVDNEVEGTGYTAGGATLGTKSVNYDAPTNAAWFDCADISWANSTITARYAVFYVSTGVDATSALIGYLDFGADVVSSNTEFKITIAAGGVFKVTAA